MASGMMYGILKEQHADHIVLSEHTRVRLADGLKLTQLGVGARIAITYQRNPDGEIVAETVTFSASPQAA
jgi:hypothetical protein